MKLDDSQFAVMIFLSIVTLSLVAGFGLGRYARPTIQTCTVILKDGFGNKHIVEGEVK
jgi:hypothetical protein